MTPQNASLTNHRDFFQGGGAGIMAWLNDGTPQGIRHARPYMEMNHNALLRKYEWEEIDRAVLDVVRTQLVAADDFRRLGLIRQLGGIATTITTYEQLSDMSPAELSMEGIVRGDQDRVEYTSQSIPVPIVFKDFSISARHLAASRRMGDGLDVTQTQVAARRVRDMVESMIFSGASKNLGGYSIAGLLTKTQRIQKTAAQCGGGDWATEGNPYKTLLGGIGFLSGAGFNGPYGVYVARDQYIESLHRLTDGSSKSELQAIMDGIPNLSFIKPADSLSTGTVVMWQLSGDVADIAIGQDIATIQWDVQGGMATEFRIMTVLTPRVKHDYNGACGVLHITSA